MSLTAKRCFNHSGREAVAKCLDCGSFFCRECITEHNGRLTCCNCLEKTSAKDASGKAILAGLASLIMVIVGLLVLWAFFFFIATRLLKVESDAFQQGALPQSEQTWVRYH